MNFSDVEKARDLLQELTEIDQGIKDMLSHHGFARGEKS